jgi:hypothetical protein
MGQVGKAITAVFFALVVASGALLGVTVAALGSMAVMTVLIQYGIVSQIIAQVTVGATMLVGLAVGGLDALDASTREL